MGYGKISLFFAETLKKLRTEKGLSQRELAEQVFVTRPTVNRWENGSRLPRSQALPDRRRLSNTRRQIGWH